MSDRDRRGPGPRAAAQAPTAAEIGEALILGVDAQARVDKIREIVRSRRDLSDTGTLDAIRRVLDRPVIRP